MRKEGILLVVLFLICYLYFANVQAIPSVLFNYPTPLNNSLVGQPMEINISISELNLADFTLFFDNANYSVYNNLTWASYNFQNLLSLGENSTKVCDISKNNYDGYLGAYSGICPAIHGASCAWTSGVVGNSLQFDANIANHLINSSANWRSADSTGTIMGWVYLPILPAGTNYYTIFSSSDESTANYFLTLQIYSNGKVEITQKNADTADTLQTTRNLSIGRWNHIALTSNSTAYAIYINGSFETLAASSGSNTGDWFADTSLRDNFAVGISKKNSFSSPFNGKIDEFKVWNRTLSASEISDIYTNESAGNYDANINRTRIIAQ